jgi:hypothetical protein
MKLKVGRDRISGTHKARIRMLESFKSDQK